MYIFDVFTRIKARMDDSVKCIVHINADGSTVIIFDDYNTDIYTQAVISEYAYNEYYSIKQNQTIYTYSNNDKIVINHNTYYKDR